MAKHLVNPFELPGKWYKGNFHTHSRLSDGALWVEDCWNEYRKRGYDFVVISDHERSNDVRGLSDKKFLIINGMEMHPPYRGRIGNYHIVALGLPHGFLLSRAGQRDIQPALDEVHRVGGASIMAHPKELKQTWDETFGFKHLHGIEVWTMLSEIDSEDGSSEAHWAEVMEHGMFLTAVGADDTHWAKRHHWRDAFGGWGMVKLTALTVANVVKAIRTGATYASAGPTIHDFRRQEDGRVTVRCSPARKIEFKCMSETVGRKHADLGKGIQRFTADWPKGARCVRAVVTDEIGRKAWTNPIWPKR